MNVLNGQSGPIVMVQGGRPGTPGAPGPVGPAHSDLPPPVYNQVDYFTMYKHSNVNVYDGSPANIRYVKRYNIVSNDITSGEVTMFRAKVEGWTSSNNGRNSIDLSFSGFLLANGISRPTLVDHAYAVDPATTPMPMGIGRHSDGRFLIWFECENYYTNFIATGMRLGFHNNLGATPCELIISDEGVNP